MEIKEVKDGIIYLKDKRNLKIKDIKIFDKNGNEISRDIHKNITDLLDEATEYLDVDLPEDNRTIINMLPNNLEKAYSICDRKFKLQIVDVDNGEEMQKVADELKTMCFIAIIEAKAEAKILDLMFHKMFIEESSFFTVLLNNNIPKMFRLSILYK